MQVHGEEARRVRAGTRTALNLGNVAVDVARMAVVKDDPLPAGKPLPDAGESTENHYRNLRVDRIVPLHGKIVPYAQLVKDAARPTS